MKLTPGFYPADAGLGYVELARKDAKAALPHFDRALERDAQQLSALVGRGQALLALNRESEALAAFEAALAVDPSLGELARRVEVLRFRGQQNDLNRARTAALAGRFEDAIALYTRAIQARPIVPSCIVNWLRSSGNRATPIARWSTSAKPARSSPATRRRACRSAKCSRPAATSRARTRPRRRRSRSSRTRTWRRNWKSCGRGPTLARLPAEYRAIDDAPQITRGDLAALIGVRLAGLLRDTRARDAGGHHRHPQHWAASWIMTVARAGVMDPFANHGFQPRTVVRRIDLAQVVNRLLGKVAEATPRQPHPWLTARLKFPDLALGHVAYPAASAAVASGVMTAGANNSFQPSAPVTGQEAARRSLASHAMVPAAAGQETPADDGAHAGEPADVAPDAADSGFRDSGVIRACRVGVDGIRHGRHDRRPRRSDCPPLRPEDEAWRLARPHGRQALLVTTFIVLTMPGLGLENRLPVWLTVIMISRDVVIVLTVTIVNLAIGPRTFRPSIYGKIATATYIVTAVVAMLFNYLRRRSSSSTVRCTRRWRSR